MFEVGQTVVCIDDKPAPFEVPYLVRGNVYTIRDIRNVEFQDGVTPGVWLEESQRKFNYNKLRLDGTWGKILNPIIDEIENEDRPWGACRFRPLKKSETEITIELLAPVDKPELVDI